MKELTNNSDLDVDFELTSKLKERPVIKTVTIIQPLAKARFVNIKGNC